MHFTNAKYFDAKKIWNVAQFESSEKKMLDQTVNAPVNFTC